jgi:hypothetical protein
VNGLLNRIPVPTVAFTVIFFVGLILFAYWFESRVDRPLRKRLLRTFQKNGIKHKST